MRYIPKFNRRLLTLLFTQAITGSTVPVLFIISGLIGPDIAPSLKLSTLPISMVVVGIALMSPIASWVMAKMGRRLGHSFGLSLTLIGVACAGAALTFSNFYIYTLGAMICGMGMAFNNQVRFTAAEAGGEQKALVHSWVLMFSLFAAFLGPSIADFGRNILAAGEYTGSLAILFSALFVTLLVMLTLPDGPKELDSTPVVKKIGTREILSHGKFWFAAFAGIASFATMTLLMTATPLQMHHMHHFSNTDTTHTIRSHIVAMYLPSLFGGLLIAWLGVRKLILFGVALFLICIGIGYGSESLHEYWWVLVILGVGWNFLFLAGSTLISQSYDGPERFAAQGANDTIVYGVQAVASLASGWLLFEVGWKNLVLFPLPFLAVVLFGVFRDRPHNSV